MPDPKPAASALRLDSGAATRQGRVVDIPGLYARLIIAIGDGTGMADSLLHVHAGLAVLFLARIISRRGLSTLGPLLAVLVAEIANEGLDRLHYGSWRWSDTIGDFVNTLFWPTMLYLGLRWRTVRSSGGRRR